MLIRIGVAEDLPAVLGLVHELAAYELAPDAVTNTLEQMQAEQAHFRFFVVEDEGQVVGVALYFFAYYTWVGKSLYLDDIYVKPEYRSHGIGSQLLRKVFETAQAENCKRVRWQVLDWNLDAIRFYRRCGAQLSKEWYNCDLDADGIAAFLDGEMGR